MPQIYHAVPLCGIRNMPLTLSVLIEDEGSALLRVLLHYEAQGEPRTLRLLPTDGYKGEDHYSLYTVTVPAEALCEERFSYRLSVEGEYTRAYEFSLEAGDTLLEGELTAPAILPLYAPARYYLSGGDLCLRFLTFPWDTAGACVLVREQDEWHAYAATLNQMGEWECVLPISLLNTLGSKISYFVETKGATLAALLGSEREPLSMRLVDDAGPLLTSVFPAEGEAVAENPPQIRVTYEDASGVDLRMSAVFLDGKNVEKNAVWTANGMSFRPQKPLGSGEHVLEISLRDIHGNRTYCRFVFLVVGEDGSGSKTEKKAVSVVQAAGFFASAFGTLKKLFSNKE